MQQSSSGARHASEAYLWQSLPAPACACGPHAADTHVTTPRPPAEMVGVEIVSVREVGPSRRLQADDPQTVLDTESNATILDTRPGSTQAAISGLDTFKQASLQKGRPRQRHLFHPCSGFIHAPPALLSLAGPA